ncbi:HutD family protein [Pantoea sp. BAV 3049]|uniref:HutD/Ves family protein n=1 Tax=Pantoea sp. BAV 3049 TaxID=2654188 RepID=UPI00131D7427|nr:HutD family protein [Pantoea sp. BAV 3049]
MIQFYDSQTLPVSRWRNGGGETREIISFPPGVQTFSWRISIATIATDGAFSLFPGVDRVITLLSGNGVQLNAAESYSQLLQPNQPFAFAGEDQIHCRLTGGVSSDFNVMTRRATHQADVRVTSEAFSPAPAAAGVVYVLAGEWVTGDLAIGPGQGVWWENQGKSLAPTSAEALLLLAEIAPRAE